jgi:MOSC domain-containing protein YiiM
MLEGTGDGVVVQLNRKPEVPGEHGLPKVPAESARVGRQGVEGDFNRYRHEEKGDHPDMAILLLPLEVIDALNREGWPVRPGDLGENITTSGIENDSFHVSDRVRIGPVLLEVSKPCDPCTNLFLLPYVGERRGPEFLKTAVGRRGWYCRVVEEGTLHPGDRIRLESR